MHTQENKQVVKDLYGAFGRGDIASRACADCWSRGRVKSTGRTFDDRWVMVFIVRERQIAEFEEYADTQALAASHDTSPALRSGFLSHKHLAANVPGDAWDQGFETAGMAGIVKEVNQMSSITLSKGAKAVSALGGPTCRI